MCSHQPRKVRLRTEIQEHGERLCARANGTQIHLRVGGKGPAVILIHLTMPVLAIGGEPSMLAWISGALVRRAAVQGFDLPRAVEHENSTYDTGTRDVRDCSSVVRGLKVVQR